MVIAVITLLAAILLPVFAQVREKARQTACLSNCRQIGLAMMMYTEDHDEVILPVLTLTGQRQEPQSPDPSRRGAHVRMWTQLIQPYLKNDQVLYCPSFNEPVLVENAAQPGCDGPGARRSFPARYYYAHYGLAFNMVGGGCTPADPRWAFPGNGLEGAGWRTLSQIARPAETAIIQDNYTGQFDHTFVIGIGFGCHCGTHPEGRSRHHQGCNYIFLDGHAKTLRGDPETAPLIACPGARIGTRTYPDCVCARYTTWDF